MWPDMKTTRSSGHRSRAAWASSWPAHPGHHDVRDEHVDSGHSASASSAPARLEDLVAVGAQEAHGLAPHGVLVLDDHDPGGPGARSPGTTCSSAGSTGSRGPREDDRTVVPLPGAESISTVPPPR